MDSLLKQRQSLSQRIGFNHKVVATYDGNTSTATFQVANQVLQQFSTQLDDLHRKIIDKCTTDEEIEDASKAYSDIQKELSEIMVRIITLFPTNVSGNRGSNQVSTTSNQYKLERITLPKFNGKFSEWEEFRDLFSAAVHNNGFLSGAEKMVYLKTSLAGDALAIVSSFTTTDASYAAAWDLVKQRFSNPREIAFSHLKKLFELQKGQDNANDIRRIIDLTNELIRSLKNIMVPVDQWDVILVFWILRKLDSETRKEWLLTQDVSLPTLKDILTFLETRARALEDTMSKSKVDLKKTTNKSVYSALTFKGCASCGNSHSLHNCDNFLKKSVPERKETVKQSNLCFNCLARGHNSLHCQSKFSCRHCQKRHHSLLHSLPILKQLHQVSGNSSGQLSIPGSSKQCNYGTVPTTHVLLETALVDVLNSEGKKSTIRIFVDNGSEAEFITEGCVKRLGLTPSGRPINVAGLGGVNCGSSLGRVKVTLHSKINNFSLLVSAEVMGSLTTGNLPQYPCKASFSHFNRLKLADPEFFTPKSVDLILGARHASRIKLGGLLHGPPGTPSAEETQFGWVLSGNIPLSTKKKILNSSFVMTHTAALNPDKLEYPISEMRNNSIHDSDLNYVLSKFWETEESECLITPRSVQDEICETIFTTTTTREENGRYVVSLPFQKNHQPLGDSLSTALKRFYSLERRIQSNPSLSKEYSDYFKSHLSSGVIEFIPSHELHCERSKYYYMPYSEVRKDNSTTTKVRVVFDCSAKSYKSLSLNEVLYSGPKLQVDLLSLLVRFRTYPYALSGDIVKFFNQVSICKDHKDFQRLLYREAPTLPISHFRMTRLTFGVTSAPFLAIRTLQKLFEDECDYPLLHRIIKEDTLVDNILTGSFSLPDALHIQTQLLLTMSKGQLQLKKWASNVNDLLLSVPEEDREVQIPLTISDTQGLSTLGVKWHPVPDHFTLAIPTADSSVNSTKRSVLSFVARIFDPLGWVTPVTIRAKILLQNLWREKLDWDTTLTPPLLKEWERIRSDLLLIDQIQIPRCYSRIGNGIIPHHHIIGFSDASNLAYAAVVYMKTVTMEGETQITLIGSKSKVAPVKGDTTPRLELSGARLLTSFIKTILDSLRVTVDTVTCFTDSTSVLGQINAKSTTMGKKEVFILNRVRYIQRTLPQAKWLHVSGADNPADCASRGVKTSHLLTHRLWYNGPRWLLDEEMCFTTHAHLGLASYSSQLEDVLHEIISKFSSPVKMQRIVATCLRFGRILKSKTKNDSPLTAIELGEAQRLLVGSVQRERFKEEILRISSSTNKLPKRLKLLAPFLDKEGLLRVGGRLRNADISHEQKHPLLLPKNHIYSTVLAHYYHCLYQHAGPTLLLCLLREKYWIQGGANLVKMIVRKCVVCHRHDPRPLTQIMADLPKSRVTFSRAFLHTGMDFAGPFYLATAPGRKPKILKNYLCIFVCMSVKAVHLEVVGDLSTSSFLAALKRFTSRRGLPTDLYSDGGKNFIGGKSELDRVTSFLSSTEFNQNVFNYCSQIEIIFHFNPPLSPHHGGLFEAAVKSVKYHLCRIVEDRHLTLEEMTTVVCQIEGILNSRPLTQMSTDPSDVSALTPAHFLVGGSLISVPELNLIDRRLNLLKRWEQTQQIAQHLSKRFHQEYLQILQSRPKWLENLPNIQPGVLVLIKESDANFSNHKWNLARVTQVFPGSDGKVRVVEVKSPNGSLYRRPIVKVAPLPLD